MKTVLLAGGFGTRLAEHTDVTPKPMVHVGGRPMLWHIMNIYAAQGVNEFVVALGYKGEVIKEYFLNFYAFNNDISVDLARGTTTIRDGNQPDWKVHLVDTGLHTMTGGRLKRLRDWLDEETFMVTYSDGVGNIDINALIDFHKAHGKLATVTAVQPPARFGNLELEGGQVTAFTEKVRKHETWINGGFFVFEPGVFDYLPGDEEPLEQYPLTKLAQDGELMAYKHTGFWHPMDTVRDRDHLDKLASGDMPPWRDFGAVPAGKQAFVNAA
jgi:glucose-1-phosphate cytidylyltransferase